MNADRPLESWYRDQLYTHKGISELLCAADFEYQAIAEFRVFKEYRVPGGYIDLLIAYPGSVVVVEFKRDIADEGAVSQCLRYMGSLQFKTRGIVAAPRFTPGAHFAASPLNGILALVQLDVSVKCGFAWSGLGEEGPIDRDIIAIAWPDGDPNDPFGFEAAEDQQRASLLTEAEIGETTPLPVLSGALEGGGGAADVFVSGAGAVDRHDVRNA